MGVGEPCVYSLGIYDTYMIHDDHKRYASASLVLKMQGTGWQVRIDIWRTEGLGAGFPIGI